MRRCQILFLILAFISFSLAGQVNRSGAPVVSTVDVIGTPGEALNWCITMDTRGVMYFGTASKGIVTYNGNQWGLIPLNKQQRVDALATDLRGTVYAGCSADFGFLRPDIRGDLKFVSLAGRLTDSVLRSELQSVSSIATDTRKAYFTDRRKLYIYDFISDSLSVINLDHQFNLKSAGRIISINDRIFIADNREGIFEFKDNNLTLLPGGNKIRWVKFMTLLPYGKEQLLVTTVDNGVYLLNYSTGEVRKNFLSDSDNERLTEEFITGAAIIPGNRIAIGVEGGPGIYIFDNNGALKQQITVETSGVPESSVTAMYCDYSSNSQLWFCTRGYIHRAYVSLPVSSFGSMAGIKTPLTDIRVFNGETYVSGDQGLYVSYTDYTGQMKFTNLEGIDSKLFGLLNFKTPGKEVLIAATEKGLYQVDKKGTLKRVSDNFNVRAVRADLNDPTVILAGSGSGIINRLKYTGDRFVPVTGYSQNDVGRSVLEIEQTPDGVWWILTSLPSSLYRLGNAPSDTLIRYGRDRGLNSDTLNHIVTIDNKLYVCTGYGIYRFNPESDSFEKDDNLVGNTFRNTEILRIFKTPERELHVSGHDFRYFDALVTPTSQGHVVFRRQFDFLPDIPTTDIEYIDGNIWIIKGKTIYVIDKSRLGYNYGSFSTFFTNITAGRDSVLMNGSFWTITPEGTRIPAVSQPEGKNPVLRHKLNDLSLKWTTTYYVGEEKTEYRYKLEGFDHDWSKWEKRNSKDYTNLPHGDYIFKLKSKTVAGLESEETSFRFSVRKSWYQVTASKILYFLIAGYLLFSIIRLSGRKLRNENIHLKKLVHESRAEVAHQRKELESSIHYAGKIQQALLPSEKVLSDSASGSFILYRPRDIVSGDFYWMSRKGNRLYVVAADCTGHGVPGAFMSLLGISLLDEVINRLAFHKANEVLSEMRKQVISSLKQVGEVGELKDGIDMALLVIDYDKNLVEFAGANIPCFKVRALDSEETELWQSGEFVAEEGAMSNGKYLLETVNADKMPVGISLRMDKKFRLNEWDLEKDVSYYLFTDGYIDQFNGITGRKFMKKNFKKLILDIQTFQMARQKEILEERLKSWMGSSPQIDDILVIGLKAKV